MRTERQINASRTNGSKSHGPITEEGKHASSRNATKHAMLAGTIVLECESEDRFRELLTSLLEEFHPETDFEASLVESMAAARWRQQRVWAMEKANMDNAIQNQTHSCHSDHDTAVRAALAFRDLGNDNRSLDLIIRYETLYERQYFRAHRRLMEVQGNRTPPSAPAVRLAPVIPFPEPEPAPETPAHEVISAKRTQQVVENKTPCESPIPAPPAMIPDTDSAPGARCDTTRIRLDSDGC